MKTILTGLLCLAGAVALVLVFTFGMEYGSLQWKRFFKPKHAAVEREVFLETRSYNEGKVQELIKLRLEYLEAKERGDNAAAGAIKSTIRHSFAEFDSSGLRPELRYFLDHEIMGY